MLEPGQVALPVAGLEPEERRSALALAQAGEVDFEVAE